MGMPLSAYISVSPPPFSTFFFPAVTICIFLSPFFKSLFHKYGFKTLTPSFDIHMYSWFIE
jgi:hypothetical protein